MNPLSLFKYSTVVLTLVALSSAGTAQNGFQSEGNGTKANPYEIKSVEDLSQIRLDKDAYYDITEDIDASQTQIMNNVSGEPKGFQPITGFEGHLDGKGHTISDIYINRPNKSNVGLFGSASRAQFVNIRLKDFKIRGKSDVGALVGYGRKADIGYCSLHGRLGLPSQKPGKDLGGIAGDFSGRIRYCKVILTYSANSSVSGDAEDTFVGGLVGRVQSPNSDTSSIKNAYVDLNKSNNEASEFVGFLDGEVKNLYTIEDKSVRDADRELVSQSETDMEGIKVVKRNNSESISSYPGLNFDETWKIGSGGVPALRYENENFPGYKSDKNSSETHIGLEDCPEPFVDNSTAESAGNNPCSVLGDIGCTVYRVLSGLIK